MRATEPAGRGELKREGAAETRTSTREKGIGLGCPDELIWAGVPLDEQQGVNVLRDLARIYGPAALLVALGLLVAYHFLPPAPPMHLVMATSNRDEPYYAYGLRYRDELAREGITLELRETAGAVENLRLLQDPASGVDIAFTQGGIDPVKGGTKVRAIASVFLEPLWLFTRKPVVPESIRSLAGLRVAVGAAGSGTREMLEELLTINRMSPDDLTLVSLADRAAAAALRADQVDVVATVTPPPIRSLPISRRSRVSVCSISLTLAATANGSSICAR